MNNNYPTDDFIMQLFGDWFDPCTLSNGELRDFDGLGSSWKDKTFVNPPYSNALDWIKKGIEENKKGKTIVFLLKSDNSTRWFAQLQNNGAKFLWINGRLKYKTGIPAPFPSMIAILPKAEQNQTPQTKQEDSMVDASYGQSVKRLSFADGNPNKDSDKTGEKCIEVQQPQPSHITEGSFVTSDKDKTPSTGDKKLKYSHNKLGGNGVSW